MPAKSTKSKKRTKPAAKRGRRRAKTASPVVECPEQLRPLLESIETIHPAPHNPRAGHAVDAIARSLRDLGWHAPIVVRDDDGEIIVGHGRHAAALSLGLAVVPVLRVDDDKGRAVARMVADNRLTDLASWDLDALDALVDEYRPDLETWSQPLELDELLGYDPANVNGDVEPEPDSDAMTDIDTSEDSPDLAAFIERRRKSRERAADKQDSSFWLCLVFQSTDQKFEFLERFPNLETRYGMYVNGETFAEATGVSVTPNGQNPVVSPLDQALSDRVISSEADEIATEKGR